ncbi:MAG: cyclic nucleotide-binding domain-containing protein [Myxococcales bacterium]
MSVEMLRQCPLFKDFTAVGLEILAKISKPRILLAGKPLFLEGKPSESLYIVVEGRLAVMVKGPDGRESPVASLGAGEHLGEMALLAAAKKPLHLVSVLAEADSKIVEIPNADFQALMKEKPQACMKLLLSLSAEFGRKSVEAREPLRHIVTRALGR